jgi:hypothetical protein
MNGINFMNWLFPRSGGESQSRFKESPNALKKGGLKIKAVLSPPLRD